MTTELPVHAEAVQERLQRIREQSMEVLQVGVSMGKAGGGALFPLDLLAFGAIKRHVSTSAGFCQLVEAWNILCARALLRIHIDTAVRFSAAWFVADPQEFASKVLKGVQINHMKDREGRPLTDKYLVDRHAVDHPWLPSVYKNLSGYVHLSASHIVAPFRAAEGDLHPLEIGEADTNMPDASWVEIEECFLETSDIFLHYLRGWTATKDLPKRPEREV